MWFHRLREFYREVTIWLGILGTTILLAIALLITGDIGGRAIFGTPIKAAFEIGHYFGAYAIFLCLAFATMSGRQLVIDFINFSPSKLILLDGIGLLLGLFVVVLATWGSVRMTFYSMKIGNIVPQIYLPLYIIYIATVIGFLFLGVALLIEFVALLQRFVRK